MRRQAPVRGRAPWDAGEGTRIRRACRGRPIQTVRPAVELRCSTQRRLVGTESWPTAREQASRRGTRPSRRVPVDTRRLASHVRGERVPEAEAG